MHVAIIMDGNGRWAEQRGLVRTAGHRAGARAVRRVVEAAARASIEVLTLYAFSSDNWRRPRAEVQSLMALFRRYLQSEVARCVDNGVRICVIGRRDRLHRSLVGIIEQAEQLTAHCRGMILQIAVDYSAREAIARTAAGSTDRSTDFGERLAATIGSPTGGRAVDLLIRTGGEQRLSDFLLWECAYAELVFVGTYWPDFDEHAFGAALAEFQRRERRFGSVPARVADDRVTR